MNNKLERILAKEKYILAEGSIIERLSREFDVEFDPYLYNARMYEDKNTRIILEKIYREYLDIGHEFDLPIIVLLPTWKANPDALAKAGVGDGKKLIQDNYSFLQNICSSYGAYSEKILVGGLMGPKGDAYNPVEALSEKDAEFFHKSQAEWLAASGVDFVVASTMPSLSEATGIAKAISTAHLPYMISFVARKTGKLLDRTPINKAIEYIDSVINPNPTRYMFNCIHPTNLMEGIRNISSLGDDFIERIVGLQANASRLDPAELDGSTEFYTEDPGLFAGAMLEASGELGLKILGGCCGTTEKHIHAIAERITKT